MWAPRRQSESSETVIRGFRLESEMQSPVQDSALSDLLSLAPRGSAHPVHRRWTRNRSLRPEPHTRTSAAPGSAEENHVPPPPTSPDSIYGSAASVGFAIHHWAHSAI